MDTTGINTVRRRPPHRYRPATSNLLRGVYPVTTFQKCVMQRYATKRFDGRAVPDETVRESSSWSG